MFSGRSESAEHACGRVGVSYERYSRQSIPSARIRAVSLMLISIRLCSSRQLAARPDAAEAAGYRTNRHDARKILELYETITGTRGVSAFLFRDLSGQLGDLGESGTVANAIQNIQTN